MNDLPDIETTDTAVGEYFFEDGARRFWAKDSNGDWVHWSRQDFKLFLKRRGLCPICDFRRGETLSEVDEELVKTVQDRRVQYAGRVAGWPRGIHSFEDTRALVVRSPQLIEPARGDWPILREFLVSRFSAGEVDQLPYLLGWWQHVLRSLYDGRPSRGLCLVLAGEAGSGKTLLKDIIKASTGNREVYPYDTMIGRDHFNADLAEAVIWTVDDESADTSGKGRNAFGAQIKKVCANTAMRCRGLYKDGLTLEPLRRLIICVNCEPDKLQVLPELADDINDKLMIFLVAGGAFPMPMKTQEQKDAFFSAVCDELPSFVHHLLHEYRLPDEYLGERFGVAPYHNDEVVGMLHELSSEAELEQVLDKYIFVEGRTEYGPISTSELLRVLTCDDSPLPQSVQKAPYFRGEVSLGKRLHALARIHSDRYEYSRGKAGRRWILRASGGQVRQVVTE